MSTTVTPVVVTLPSAVNYTVAPVRQVSLTTLTIQRIVDLQGAQKVVAFVKEIPGAIVLWSGAAYVAAGDWTQAAAQARLIAIVSGTATN